MTVYDEADTLREARRVYFDANGFGADGGYAAAWVPVKVGPLPLRIPNTPGRVRAVRLHDLHHVVTGYATDFAGEAEIGAWEVASGCADHYAAWVLNLFAFWIGFAFAAPRRVFRAFLRGRRSRNLYRTEFGEALLDRRVGAVRAELGLDQPPAPARAGDLAAFLLWLAAGAALSLASLAPIAVVVAIVVALVR